MGSAMAMAGLPRSCFTLAATLLPSVICCQVCGRIQERDWERGRVGGMGQRPDAGWRRAR